MSESELAAIEARARAATPAPWYPFISPWPDKMHAVTVGYEGGPPVCYVGNKVIGENEANRDFIAASREDVPALLAEVRRLRAALTEIDGRCGQYPYPPANQERAMLIAIRSIVRAEIGEPPPRHAPDVMAALDGMPL